MSKANGWSGSLAAQTRRQWAPRVATGRIACTLCGEPIKPGDAWDVGHIIPISLGGDVAGLTEPQHATCNRRDGARIARMRQGRTRRWS